jgi:aspartyl-tRNA(Asn)/glutamyl-tRNA(Gln) amidotransferase subunit A
MERLRGESGRLFAEADLLVTPASPGPAFEYGKPAGLIFLRNSAPWNLYGLPSISIPCGFTSAGLPVGLQITGQAKRDDMVLALADAYQQSTDWHKRRPAL